MIHQTIRSISRLTVAFRVFPLMVLLLAGLSGCVQPPVPQDRYYHLQIAAPEAGAAVLDGVLEVDRFDAEGLSSGRAIIYADTAKPGILQEYNYDFWVEPPSDLIRGDLIDYMRVANLAKAIVTPESRAKADYLLEGRLNRIVTRRGDKPAGIVDMDISITRENTGKLVMVKHYSYVILAADGTVKAGVDAINQGIQAAFAQFASDLRAAR